MFNLYRLKTDTLIMNFHFRNEYERSYPLYKFITAATHSSVRCSTKRCFRTMTVQFTAIQFILYNVNSAISRFFTFFWFIYDSCIQPSPISILLLAAVSLNVHMRCHISLHRIFVHAMQIGRWRSNVRSSAVQDVVQLEPVHMRFTYRFHVCILYAGGEIISLIKSLGVLILTQGLVFRHSRCSRWTIHFYMSKKYQYAQRTQRFVFIMIRASIRMRELSYKYLMPFFDRMGRKWWVFLWFPSIQRI